MKVAYRANGKTTERLRIDLALDEAQAFAEAWEHIAEHVDAETHPIFRGLRRIATELAAEKW